MKAAELDKLFDDGEVDVADEFDWLKATRPNLKDAPGERRFPRLDRQSARPRGPPARAPRQALIMLWIAERLGKAA